MEIPIGHVVDKIELNCLHCKLGIASPIPREIERAQEVFPLIFEVFVAVKAFVYSFKSQVDGEELGN